MEVIQLAGYTADEKLHIAKRYLVPRQLAENGLKGAGVRFADAALRAIIDEYTREAGVRNLEREIGTVCRKIAREIAEAKREAQDGQADRLGEAGARAARAPARLLRDAAADQGPRGRDRPRLDAGRRRGAVHRGDRDAGLGPADDHRPARRRDARVRAGGALVGARPRAQAQPRAARRLVRRARHPHPRAGRRGAQGRPLGRGGDGDRAHLADPRQAGLAARPR